MINRIINRIKGIARHRRMLLELLGGQRRPKDGSTNDPNTTPRLAGVLTAWTTTIMATKKRKKKDRQAQEAAFDVLIAKGDEETQYGGAATRPLPGQEEMLRTEAALPPAPPPQYAKEVWIAPGTAETQYGGAFPQREAGPERVEAYGPGLQKRSLQDVTMSFAPTIPSPGRQTIEDAEGTITWVGNKRVFFPADGSPPVELSPDYPGMPSDVARGLR
jgi:hypothetical protein